MTRQPARHVALDLMAAWMAPFAPLFTRPTFANLLVLVTGALLVPGRRTVAAALSILGLREAGDFTNFHRVLNRGCWSSQALARTLLGLLVTALVPPGPVVVVDDDDDVGDGAGRCARGADELHAARSTVASTAATAPALCKNRRRSMCNRRAASSASASAARSTAASWGLGGSGTNSPLVPGVTASGSRTSPSGSSSLRRRGAMRPR